MPRNDWQALYGKRRREIDRAILAEAERQIAAQERATLAQDRHLASEGVKCPKTSKRPSAAASAPRTLDSEARNAIARAFGRALT